IVRAGAIPVFIDIDPITYNMDPSNIEEAITDKTKAIIPVHLYGQMADMADINRISKKYNLVIIEYAAIAIGSEYHEYKPGELKSAATYSLFPTKNLCAYGDGGMIITSRSELADKSRVIRVHGSKPKYHHHVLGYNSRLDEIQAAVLNVKLKKLSEFNQRRRSRAIYYTAKLSNLLSDYVIVPIEKKGNYHVYHQYTIRVNNRDELQSFLIENGINTMVYYPMPLHLQPVFNNLGYSEGEFPVSEKMTHEVLSLPMYPELKVEEQDYIIEKIVEFYKG